MKFTNRHGMLGPVAMALQANDYDKHGDWSVTTLLDSPRAKLLFARHEDEVVADVMDQVWSVRGSAMHFIMSQTKYPGAIKEERFMITVLGRKVSMKPDFAYPISGTNPVRYHLLDFKDCTVWLLKNKRRLMDYTRQLNAYAYGLRLRGFNVTAADLVLWFKDWSYTDAIIKRERDYPRTPVINLEIPVWSDEVVLNMLEKRVRLFEQYKDARDDDLPKCTEEERWAKPDVFAVKKVGSDKALPGGIHTTRSEAVKFAQSRTYETTIEYREGESPRCDRYCLAAKFCNQYQAIKRRQRKEDPF